MKPISVRARLLFGAGVILLALLCSDLRADAASLIVYGRDWALTIHEPNGWVGDIEGAALYDANVIFYKRGETPSYARAAIRIVVATKVDENTADDLRYDMNEYRKQYAGVEFRNFDIPAGRYKAFPKLFCVPGEFYEYVTYLNPGPKSPLLVSVAMNTGKHPATADELDAYRSVIRSLTVLSGIKVREPGESGKRQSPASSDKRGAGTRPPS